MSKRIDLRVNLAEINLLIEGLSCQSLVADKSIKERLLDLLEESAYDLDEDLRHTNLYIEDEDGYEVLTEMGREALAETYKKND